MASQGSSASPYPALSVLAFVHGFKGDDTTFGDFPQRLRHALSSTFGDSSEVHALVYPAFETRGELSLCVENFGSWLTMQVAEIEMHYAQKLKHGQKEIARVVLIGHSMGGIVVADCARSTVKGWKHAGEAKVWPRIVGVLAYDTPYLGVHPSTFKNTVTEAWSYVQQAQAVASSVGMGWAFLNGQKAPAGAEKAATSSSASKGKGKQKAANQDESAVTVTEKLGVAGKAAQQTADSGSASWLKYGYAAAGATALAAAAGTAWYSRQKIASTATDGQTWVTSHMEFVGALWKTKDLQERLQEVLDLEESGVAFHCFYTQLATEGRTFIVLPTRSTFSSEYVRCESHFSPNVNNKAKNEIEAHTTMFGLENDGIFTLGKESSALITSWLTKARRIPTT